MAKDEGNGDGEYDEEQMMFDHMPVAPARNTDPYTSHLAADAQTPEKVAPVRAAVLLALYGPPGEMTDGDLWLRLGGPESSPRKRRGELEKMGLVEPAGETTSMYGKPTFLWRLSAAGTAYVASHLDALTESAAKRRNPPIITKEQT